MLFSKTLIVLAAAVFAMAAPTGRLADEGATCTYHMTPSEEVPELDVDREVNYTLVRAILDVSPTSTLYNYGITPVVNNDGSYSNTGKIEAYGLTADQLKKIVAGWSGKTLNGLPAFGIVWTVEDVTCQ